MVLGAESHPLSAFGITERLESGVVWFTLLLQATSFIQSREDGSINVRTFCTV